MNENTLLIACDAYTVNRIVIRQREAFEQAWPFLDVSVLEGKGTIDGREIVKGDHFIIPNGYGTFTLDGEMLLVTSHL